MGHRPGKQAENHQEADVRGEKKIKPMHGVRDLRELKG